jgi:hypothetical protein
VAASGASWADQVEQQEQQERKQGQQEEQQRAQQQPDEQRDAAQPHQGQQQPQRRVVLVSEADRLYTVHFRFPQGLDNGRSDILKRLALSRGARSVLVDLKHGNVAAGIPDKAAAEQLISTGGVQALPVSAFW